MLLIPVLYLNAAALIIGDRGSLILLLQTAIRKNRRRTRRSPLTIVLVAKGGNKNRFILLHLIALSHRSHGGLGLLPRLIDRLPVMALSFRPYVSIILRKESVYMKTINFPGDWSLFFAPGRAPMPHHDQPGELRTGRRTDRAHAKIKKSLHSRPQHIE
jgi:hypothetical protein